MGSKTGISRYFSEYTVANVYAMIKNNRRDPKICSDEFKGKLVVISGATAGIGYLTARKYASKGANLLCINRNPTKSEALKTEIERDFGVTCNFKIADLSVLKEIHKVANELAAMETPIDVMIHNAGVFLKKRQIGPDGIEKVFVVQHLAAFIINYVLRDKLKSQEKSRIILVNSEGHRFAAWGLRMDDLNWDKRSYSGLKSYGSAKLSQLLTMLIFNDQFSGSGVSINAMHPGAVKTETGQENGIVYRWYKRNILDKMLKSAELSAEALYYLGVSEEVQDLSGKFFNLTTEEEPAPPAVDREVAEEIWNKSLLMGGLS